MTTSSRWRVTSAVLVVLVVSVGIGIGVHSVAADPPEDPDHGLNETEFYPLWSHDEDGNISSSPNTTAVQDLTNGTDVPYAEPPKAVELWNRNDVSEFPETGRQTSVYPSGTETASSDRGWIQDAYARIFAIQPSTRALAGDGEQPLYVPTNGTILATADYRVNLPEDDRSGDRRVYYDLEQAEMESIRATSGARVLGEAMADNAVRVQYKGLQAGPHSLGVETEIRIEVQKTVRVEVCNDDNECHWETSREEITESVAVEDAQLVEQYSLLSTGYVTQYPNGDMGVVTKQNHPWAGLSLPGGESVRGVWQFYSGRDTEWDTLTKSTPGGTETAQSPAQPLQVYAYPSTQQAELATDQALGSPRGELLGSQGEQQSTPALPATVSLTTPEDEFNVSSQVAVRYPEYSPGAVTVQGLVAGTSRVLDPSFYTNVETRETELSVAVVNATDSTLTVRVELWDGEGRPVRTAGYDGRVIVEGTPTETNESGVAVVTLERAEKGMTAVYEPTSFWKRSPAYTSASASFAPPSSFGGNLRLLFRLALSTLILWLPVYMFDRMLDLDIWPPWEGI